MTLDVDAIGKERANVVELPDPALVTDLPDEVADLLRRSMSYPTDREEHVMLATADDKAIFNVGTSAQ
jgi:hypothetical protein